MIRISLTQSELAQAAFIACQRNVENIFIGRRNTGGLGQATNGWTEHIEGAAGEMAFAKWRNVYWNGNLGDLKADDVGRVQVRTTPHECGRLRVDFDDPNDRPFVLVTGIAPHFIIRGWRWGREAKQQKYLFDPSGRGDAYWVPQEELRKMVAANGRS